MTRETRGKVADKPPLISIIIPCYNEEESIGPFYDEMIYVEKMMPDVAFELLFIDDGSTDRTLDRISDLTFIDDTVHYVSFTRNFGKEAAFCAGFEHAVGDFVAVIDVDLQDPPELLVEMYRHIVADGVDCVATRRVDRKGERLLRSLCAQCFYHIMRRFSHMELVDGARDYRLMTRRYVNAILQLKERNRFSKGLFEWVGYETEWIEFENVERRAGETKWSFGSLVSYAVTSITDFSMLPLDLAVVAGLFCGFAALVFIVIIVIRTLAFGNPVSGWPSAICIVLFIASIQFFCLGILGAYVGKTYTEAKGRPLYLAKDEYTAVESGSSSLGAHMNVARARAHTEHDGTGRLTA